MKLHVMRTPAMSVIAARMDAKSDSMPLRTHLLDEAVGRLHPARDMLDRVVVVHVLELVAQDRDLRLDLLHAEAVLQQEPLHLVAHRAKLIRRERDLIVEGIVEALRHDLDATGRAYEITVSGRSLVHPSPVHAKPGRARARVTDRMRGRRDAAARRAANARSVHLCTDERGRADDRCARRRLSAAAAYAAATSAA